MNDRTAAGIVLIAAGIAWIVYYRRLSGSQRDALTQGLSVSGTSSTAGTAGGSSGSSGDIIPGPKPTPWRAMPKVPGPPKSMADAIRQNAQHGRDVWNGVRSDFLRLWHSIYPNVPLPGGESKPIPRFPTPPIAPSRGGY